MPLVIQRIYSDSTDAPGFRVLVDGIWPRGVSKQRARLDLWARELAPSRALRTWFDHRPDRWQTFQERYRLELDESEAAQAAIARLREELVNGPVILLYSARDEEHNQARALKAHLLGEPLLDSGGKR